MEKIQDTDSVQNQWEQICSKLKTEVGDTAFNSWLRPLEPASIEEGKVNLKVPTRFMRNWVVTHYSDRIRALWNKYNPDVEDINFIVQPIQKEVGSLRGIIRSFEKVPTPKPDAESFASREVNNVSNLDWASDSLNKDSISAPLDPRYTFENFVVGKPNEFAYAAAKRVAESKKVSFNPLFLYSGVGLGKTHLMHAIAWEIRRKDPSRTVVYLSAEKFMYKFVRAIRYKDTMAFKEQFRSVDVLMVDDVQFICGKDQTQEEFFHTFNSLIEDGRQIIISADKSPADLDGIESRLKSRLSCGLVADIHPTNFELRLGILEAKAEQLEVKVPEKVLEFLAHKIATNVRELEGALKRVVAHSQLLGGREINLEMTQDVLRDMLRSYDKRITIDDIQKKVSEHFNISPKEMHSDRRARSVARPRQIAMYLAKQLTNRSLPEIGRKFERDHTTVMHAVRKVEELLVQDSSLAEDVELLRRMLEN